jgi:hypothetical protein
VRKRVSEGRNGGLTYMSPSRRMRTMYLMGFVGIFRGRMERRVFGPFGL